MIYLRSHAKPFPEAARSHRHDHEFLKIQVVFRVASSVQHIHHRNRHRICTDSSQVLIEWKPQRSGCGLCYGHGYCQDGIGPQVGFVLRTVRIDEQMINIPLVQSVFTQKDIGDLGIYIGHCLLHTQPQIAFLAIPQFYCLNSSRRCSRRN